MSRHHRAVEFSVRRWHFLVGLTAAVVTAAVGFTWHFTGSETPARGSATVLGVTPSAHLREGVDGRSPSASPSLPPSASPGARSSAVNSTAPSGATTAAAAPPGQAAEPAGAMVWVNPTEGARASGQITATVRVVGPWQSKIDQINFYLGTCGEREDYIGWDDTPNGQVYSWSFTASAGCHTLSAVGYAQAQPAPRTYYPDSNRLRITITIT